MRKRMRKTDEKIKEIEPKEKKKTIEKKCYGNGEGRCW